ncbi:MAG: hypothetical protein Q8N36_01430, partial [bacterium]|nr:hypothetical protein [bacterium]
FVGAVTEVAKGKFQDGKLSSDFKSGLANIGNEAAQGALTSAIDGKDILEGAIKGAGKGAVDSVVDFGLGKVTAKLPKGVNVDAGDLSVSKIINNNPLSKGLAKIVTAQGLGDKAKDAIKGPIVDGISEKVGFGNPK